MSTLINNAQFDKTALLEPCNVLTNPMEHLEELASLAPANEYFAGNAIVGSLGYSLLNQLLWNFRKLNAAPKAPDPVIDIFNNSYAEQFERRLADEAMEDNGHSTLPTFDATKLIGAYMHMLYVQRGNFQFSEKYPTRMPHEILHEMQTQDRSNEVNKAYEELEAKMIEESPAANAIRAEQNRAKRALAEHQVKAHKAEQAYVLSLLQKEIPARMTEADWQSIPLYIQYKWTVFVYKQLLKAIVQEQRVSDRSDDKFERLLEMVNTVQLELEAAARTSEVKLAFEEERLDERHELLTKEVTH
jgi:hypothetical protein